MHEEWRCEQCDALLGKEQGESLHLRYKQRQYVVDGGDYRVTTVCRNCSTLNERRGGSNVKQTRQSSHE